jgi:integrase/recombinase XerD
MKQERRSPSTAKARRAASAARAGATRKHQQRNSEFNLPPETLEKLIRGATNDRDRLMMSLFAYTGVRRAELRALHAQDVEPRRQRLVIRQGKGGKQRLVFFPRSLTPLLDRYLARVMTGPLFPGPSGGALSLRTINNIVASVGRSAGVTNPNPRYKNINPHLLRHSLARNWKRNGGSIESLQKLLGHASIATTMELYGTESVVEIETNYHRMVGHIVSERAAPARGAARRS